MSYTATLLANGWDQSTHTQTVTFTDYEEEFNGVIGVPSDATAAQKEVYKSAGIDVVGQDDNEITLYAKTIPEIDLPVMIYCGAGSESEEGSSTLAGLDDVNLSSPTDGQVLKYDATNNEWVNGEGGSSGSELYLNTIYSETEEKIGYWTDGKPLYQKTIIYSGTITVDNSFYTIATLSGVDQLISNEGYFTRTGGLMYSFNGGVRSESDADTYRFTARLYNSNIQVAVKGYSDIERIAITLKYTKTTDTPEIPQRGNVIYLPTIYSEEEREVGVWYDGKPLYQLSVVLPSQTIINSNAWYTTSISNANIEKISYARGMNDEGTSFPLMANCDATGSGVNYVQIGNPRAATIGVKEFVIQYTKTTDTAGSGTWTPSGAPAVHYSTEEQVVGTWVDGKTVYQDTIYFQGSLPEGTTQVGVIQNAERFISVQGTFQQYANESDTVPSKIRQFPYQDSYGYSATIELVPNSSTNLTNVVLYKTGSWKIGVCAITIQYTKIS